MPNYITPIGFQDIESVDSLIQGAATNVGGFTINDNFVPEVEDILRKETVLWQLITSKKPAPAATVKKVRKTTRPLVDWANRSDLSSAHTNDPAALVKDVSDPGQDVKAVAGTVRWDHFGRSIAGQQNYPYGNEVSEDTEELLINSARFLEMALFTGDSTVSGNLQFNGLTRQMPSGHTYTADITSSTPDSIVAKLNEVCMRATTDRNIMRKITHIFCTGAGSLKIRDEVGQNILYQNIQEVTAGITVPAIVTANGNIPIVTTPYLNDTAGTNGAPDVIHYWLVDISSIEWYGVYPYGGTQSFDPQIFDITMYISGLPLVERRMALIYGTLYAKNRGQGIYRLDVSVPNGTVWNTASEILI